VSLAIRRITIAVLAAFLAGAVLAVPASSKSGPAAVAKKKAKKCKKAKKGKKKRKGCKPSGSSSRNGLPGQATPASPKQPNPAPGNPVHLSSLSITDSTLLRGNSTSGQVTLDQAAPTGGQQVDLTSSLPALVQVPASVVVASGQTTASFQVDTTVGTPDTATLTASIGTSNATAQLKVVDKPSVKSVELERQCFTPTTWSANRVILDVPAPSDTVVSLSGGAPLSLAPATSTVTVPSGSMSALFSVVALPLPTTGATILAAAPLTPPQSDTASVNLTAPDAQADELTLEPDEVKPGEQSTGTLTLTCEAPSGTELTLESDTTGIVLSGPGTVPEDELSVEFQITVAPGTPDGPAVISATVGGVTVQQTLTISSVLTT
jgi:hypothetical protein